MGLKTVTGETASPTKGRGATRNPEGRFETLRREVFDDGWRHGSTEGDEGGKGGDGGEDSDGPPRPQTQVTEERARSIISRNQSPDVPFDLSINAYRGCEHGCIYCYARPSHAYLDLSPGLDFETRLFAKTNAAQLLQEELARPGYRCSPISLGANTDPYQPIERDYRITRQIIEVLAQCEHPLTIVTKSALVERDLDLLAPLAAKNLLQVFLSCATLDHDIARKLEPRATAPMRRMQAIRRLSAHGIPCGVLVAPVVPFLTDAGVEAVLERAAAAGAKSAGYIVMRLPYEIKDLFKDWLSHHYPLKAAHVMSGVRALRDGKENDPSFGSRMRGQGLFADLLKARFDSACRRLGLNRQRLTLDTERFRPRAPSGQLDLF